MTDGDLIRSMRTCIRDDEDCHACMYRASMFDCRDNMICDALALIEKQAERIERLRDNLEAAVTRQKGRWVRLTGMAPPEYHGHKVCSLCDCMAPHHPFHIANEVLTPYCPGCGAEMECDDGN